jgi:hypothetical protein
MSHIVPSVDHYLDTTVLAAPSTTTSARSGARPKGSACERTTDDSSSPSTASSSSPRGTGRPSCSSTDGSTTNRCPSSSGSSGGRSRIPSHLPLDDNMYSPSSSTSSAVHTPIAQPRFRDCGVGLAWLRRSAHRGLFSWLKGGGKDSYTPPFTVSLVFIFKIILIYF